MDYSQYLRLKQEASNTYISRNKPIDSSFLTMQKQQKAAFAGSSVPGRIVSDKGTCPIDHEFIQGFQSNNRLSQQEDKASRAAGAVLCGAASNPPTTNGIYLKTCAEVSTILNTFGLITVPSNNPTPVQTKPYGQGPMPSNYVAQRQMYLEVLTPGPYKNGNTIRFKVSFNPWQQSNPPWTASVGSSYFTFGAYVADGFTVVVNNNAPGTGTITVTDSAGLGLTASITLSSSI